MRVVMWTGYAGPGWVWPKADMALDVDSKATVVGQPGGSNAEMQSELPSGLGNERPYPMPPYGG